MNSPSSLARTRAVPVLVAVLLAAGSCTGPPEVASVAEATDAFFAAWSSGDAAGMVEAFTPTAAEQWSPGRLDGSLERLRGGGQITSIEVESVGAVEQPEVESEEELDDLETSVRYRIAYTSEASAAPVAFEGELPLAYDSEDEAWLVEWDEELMLPGIPGAAGFLVRRTWLERGRIVDRAGRALAEGGPGDRSYPYGASAGSTVGHLGPVDPAEAEDAGREAGDLVGASGLERAFEDRLAGEPEARLLIVDDMGRRLQGVGRQPGSRGRTVRTTLDIDVQQAAEIAFADTVGGAVVLAPDSGDLLAVVSSSSIDPSNYIGVEGLQPFNRALSGLYPPGSAMKVVTAAAALETGTVTPETTVTGPKEYKGVRNFESGEYGSIPFAIALKYSVNTAFAQVAEDLGADVMTRFAEGFGFNSEHAMPLDSATSSFPFPDDLTDLMWGSIGQAQVLATPLEMATVAATIANGGRRMEPRITLDAAKTGERVVSRKTAATMTQLMEDVVLGGTGFRANISGVGVAGKTGTAEVDVDGKRKNHAWFICFAPSDAPEVAVAVVAELGGVGGEVAAPLAGRILLSVLPLVS